MLLFLSLSALSFSAKRKKRKRTPDRRLECKRPVYFRSQILRFFWSQHLKKNHANASRRVLARDERDLRQGFRVPVQSLFYLRLRRCFVRVLRLTRIEEVMKFFPLASMTVSLPILVAFLCPVAQSYCLQSACSADSCKIQEKVIYHQTMTPSWLDTHAFYIDSSRSTTTEQVTFNAGSTVHAALLKIPMIPAGLVRDSTPLTVDIIVAHDVSIGGGQSMDSDIRYGVSDGTRFIGFETCDKGNYGSNSPCYGVTGVPGSTLTSIGHIAVTPKPSDSFYPGQFVITLKLDERWGSCYTAHDGGFVKTAVYSNRLMASKGLTLEVYKSDAVEKVGIKYIKVAITQDA